jgi:hypothetical protein
MAHIVTKQQRDEAIKKLKSLKETSEVKEELIGYLETDAHYYKFENEDYALLRKIGMDPTTTFEVW